MKKFNMAIRSGNFDLVKEKINKDPSIVNCIFKKVRISDDGQSPLQVAIKTGHFKIANYLLDNGADVNYMDNDSVNKWKMPVIQDAIRCAVFNVRFNNCRNGIIEEINSKEKSDKAFELLKRMFSLGANIKSKDSFGNSCLDRFLLDAKQILPNYKKETDELNNNIAITESLRADLSRILKLLIDSGADINEKIRPFNISFKDEALTGVLSKVLNFDISK